MSSFWTLAYKAFKTVSTLEDQAAKSIEKYKKDFQEWLTRTTLNVLSFFLSMVFVIIGLFFIAIDYGHLPRGLVFVCGGLLGFLVLRLITPAAKS